MINPFAQSLMIAARTDRAVAPPRLLPARPPAKDTARRGWRLFGHRKAGSAAR